MYLKLAWRNIWRNKRRTLITIASVFFAVLLAIVTRSTQIGSYDNMIQNAVGFHTGYIQIHQKGYWDEKVLDNSMTIGEDLEEKLNADKNVVHYVPRIESFVLASSGETSKGTMIMGIDPEKENHVTKAAEKVVEGNYFETDNDDGVLIAQGMANSLGLGLNDTLVLFGQGYHGMMAAGKYPVQGIMKFGSPDLNSSIVYLPIKRAQTLFSAEDLVTSVVLMIKKPDAADKVSDELKAILDNEKYEVMTWKEMLPEMIQMIEMDSAGGIIMIGILYAVIAFGVFGTLLMMMNERRHEFGILVGIGMKRAQLAIIVLIETLIMAFVGALAGIAGAIPIVGWFHNHPIRFSGEMAKMAEMYNMEAIMPFSVSPGIFITQAYSVLILASILSLFPVISLLRMKALNALRS